MAKKQKKSPPSRGKYDKGHPTVSARLPIDKRDKLFAVLARLSLTLAELLIRFADEMEIISRPLEETRKAGYEEAQKRFMVRFACDVCGQMMPVTDPKEKAAVSQYMTEHRWGHEECHKRKQQL